MKRINILSLTQVFVIALITVVLLLSGCEALFEETIDIPDKEFLKVLKREGVTNNNFLTIEEAEAVLELDISTHCLEYEGGGGGVLICNKWDFIVSNLEGIEYFSNLKSLTCRRTDLTELNLSQNTALESLECSNNEKLETLILSSNDNLTYLTCEGNGLIGLDVSGCTSLEQMGIGGNSKLTSLILPDSLKGLNCYSNALTSLDVSGCKGLIGLVCVDNQLTSLDVSNNATLMGMECWRNQLTDLDVSNNPDLVELICGDNQLTSLDISKNTKLESIGIMDMPTLNEVCVWTLPFPPEGVEVNTEGSPNVYFTTECGK